MNLKVELSGFKTYEQKAIVAQAAGHARHRRPARGRRADRDDHGHRADRSDPDGNGRPRRRADRATDRQPVGHRPQLARTAAHPARCRGSPDNTAFESVSFGGGANNTQGYTVNGIRSSDNTVSLDGSNLIDIGCNSGVIVTLNNDMVQEVKVQSSNFAAEYGTGGMNVSAVTKGGSSKFSGTLYDYYRDYQFAANDRSNSIACRRSRRARSTIRAATSAARSPSATATRRTATSCSSSSASKSQRQQVDPGARFGA